MIGTTDGTLILHQGEIAVAVTVDFSLRHEIVAGQTITGTPTLAVLKNGTTSTHFTVSAATLNATSKAVQFTITVVSTAVVGDEYEIKVTVVLSGGSTLVECQRVIVVTC